jgi:hypothetical protein
MGESGPHIILNNVVAGTSEPRHDDLQDRPAECKRGQRGSVTLKPRH